MSGDPIDLDAIEARAEAATAGPWHGEHDEFGCVHVGDYGWVASGPQGQSPDYDGGTGDQGKADAEFIAHAREDVPALVAEVRRLRELVEGRALEQGALSNALPILADAADVANAWNVAGRAPAHHRSMQAQLRKAWPTLARAVESLASR